MPAILKDSFLFSGTIFGTKFKRENITESYVSIPPALVITDSRGAMWTLGNEYIELGRWYYFSVLRNDVDTDIFSSRLEYRRTNSGPRLRALTKDGWKVWVDRKTTVSGIPGYWL